MADQLYIVTVTLEAMVLAPDESEARKIVESEKAMEDCLRRRNRRDYAVGPATYLPADYHPTSLVYGGQGDVTVEEALKQAGQSA